MYERQLSGEICLRYVWRWDLKKRGLKWALALKVICGVNDVCYLSLLFFLIRICFVWANFSGMNTVQNINLTVFSDAGICKWLPCPCYLTEKWWLLCRQTISIAHQNRSKCQMLFQLSCTNFLSFRGPSCSQRCLEPAFYLLSSIPQSVCSHTCFHSPSSLPLPF